MSALVEERRGWRKRFFLYESFRRRLRWPAIVLLAVASFMGGPFVQAAELAVSWEPAHPVEGTAFIVRLHPDGWSGDGLGEGAVQGIAAGEKLHFVKAGDGTYWALAAAPLDRGNVLSLRVEVKSSDGRVFVAEETVPVKTGVYALERLTVAPQFVQTDAQTAARQARDRERALSVSRRAHETPKMWDKLVAPRESRITSPFGTGREFNGQVQSRHAGVDFAGAVGAPVHAAAAGVVEVVDAFHLAGNVVYINHGGGLVTGYFHLSEALVKEGQQVEAGDLIARVGATGRVTGPHLHWQVRYGHISIDGLQLLQLLQLLGEL